MLCAGLFFLDHIVNHARHAATTETARRLVGRFTAFGIAHEPFVERPFCPDIIIIIKCQLAALAALQILCHDRLSVDLLGKFPGNFLPAAIFAIGFVSIQAQSFHHRSVLD